MRSESDDLAVHSSLEAVQTVEEGASGNQRSIRVSAFEALAMLAQVQQWGTLAWNDIKLRYRRTTLGPLWITLGLAATVFSVGVLYGVLFGNELSHHLPYFATGLVAWTLLGSTISEGCTTYLGAAAIIRTIPVPLVVHVYRMLARHLIILAHNLLLIATLWLIFRWPPNWHLLLVLPGIALVLTTVFGLVLFLSVVAARFRDVQLIVSTTLQLVFLMTPIMWDAESLRPSGLLYVAEFNPVYHLIEVIREPLLGVAPSAVSWFSSILVALVSVMLGSTFYARYRHRVPFWI